MPKYDAFGREIGEDPLSSLRSATNPAPAEVETTTEPAAESEPVAQPDPVQVQTEPEPERVIATPQIEFVRPRRRRRGGGFAAIFVIGAIVAGIGLAANSVVEEGQDLIDRIQPEIVEPEPAPTGLQAESLIRRDNFANALQQLQDADLGRPTMLRIAPERIDATLLKGDQLNVVQITPDGELRQFGSSPGNGPAIAFKAIDPAAPEKLVRRGATRNAPASSINYVLVTPSDQLAVNAYYKGGRIVIGDRHGRPVRVL